MPRWHNVPYEIKCSIISYCVVSALHEHPTWPEVWDGIENLVEAVPDMEQEIHLHLLRKVDWSDKDVLRWAHQVLRL